MPRTSPVVYRDKKVANGIPPKVASLFMNLYSHVTETMQREAADKLGAALFG